MARIIDKELKRDRIQLAGLVPSRGGTEKRYISPTPFVVCVLEVRERFGVVLLTFPRRYIVNFSFRQVFVKDFGFVDRSEDEVKERRSKSPLRYGVWGFRDGKLTTLFRGVCPETRKSTPVWFT